MKIDLFPKKINAAGALENTSGDIYAHALRFAIGLYMVPRNSTHLLNINTTMQISSGTRASLQVIQVRETGL